MIHTRNSLVVLLGLSMALLLLPFQTRTQAQSPLTTTLTGGTITIGSMFEVKALTNLQIDSFDVRFGLISTGLPTVVEVWALNFPGTYVGNETSNTNWTQIAAVPITGIVTTPHPLGLNLAFPIPVGQTQSFYISVNNSGLRLEDSPGSLAGSLFASNSDIEFYEGVGGLHFNATMGPQVWNGNIHYTTLPTFADDVSIDSVSVSTSGQIDCAVGSAVEPVTVEVHQPWCQSDHAGHTLDCVLSGGQQSRGL